MPHTGSAMALQVQNPEESNLSTDDSSVPADIYRKEGRTVAERKRKYIITFALLFALGGVPLGAAISTTDLVALVGPTELTTAILGSGITISNVSYVGLQRAAGTFTGGQWIIGFEEGIVLGSGDIASVVGPNTMDGVTSINGMPGDAELEALTIGTTTDAAILEFDFIPDYDMLVFEYVFASDEYNEYANSGFNDVFAFFINGSNVALLPGTGTVVSINTVNGGNPYGVGAQNPEYYRNNDRDDGAGFINTEMDGLTVVLEIQAQVNRGELNHCKIAITDVGDSSWDSNVFIRRGSFSSHASPTPTPTVTATSTVTPTPTISATHTCTSTYTRSFTRTTSPTISPTYTSTPSTTLSATSTISPTVTPSVTPSDTRTASATATSTATATATPTATSSYTESATHTASVTRTETLTVTLTATHSATRTESETHTATVTPTATSSTTLTASATSTPTSTATVSETETLTSSATSSLTYTVTPTLSATGTASPSPSVTPTWTRTQTISLTFTRSSTVTPTQTPYFSFQVDIVNEAGEVVKSFYGLRAGELPDGIGLEEGEVVFDIAGGVVRDLHIGEWTISWDGSLGGKGEMIANGAYQVVVRTVDTEGQWEEEIGTLVVMKVAGDLKVTVRDGEGRLVRSIPAACGAGMLGGIRAEPSLIKPGSGGEEKAYIKSDGCGLMMTGGGEPLFWNGRNERGRAVSNGVYKVIVEKQHIDGAREILEVEVTVVRGAGGAIDNVVVYPNPKVMGGDDRTVSIKYDVLSPGAVVKVSVYDLAGELVLKAENRDSKLDYIRVDVGQLAGGLYFVSVEAAADGSPKVFRRVLRLMVVK